MLSLGQPLPDCGSLFRGDDVVISIFAVEQGDPLGLLAKILQNRVVFLGQDSHRLLRVAAGECQLGQHVFLCCQGFLAEQSSIIYRARSPRNIW